MSPLSAGCESSGSQIGTASYDRLAIEMTDEMTTRTGQVSRAVEANSELPPFREANPAEGTGTRVAARWPVRMNGKDERREAHGVNP
jgi:hypothetical protein